MNLLRPQPSPRVQRQSKATLIAQEADLRDKYHDALSRLSDVVAQRRELRDLLSQAYAHITLLGSGQTPPNSNAEMCNLLGEAIDRLDGRTI